MLHEAARALLENLSPNDPTEARHRDDMLRLLDAEAAFARNHFAPGHFTASGFVLSPEGDALLLIHHRKLSLWLQPGGHVEPGDASLWAAARREVLEECGVALAAGAPPSAFDLDVHVIPARRDEPAHRHFDVRFLFRAERRELGASDEVLDARWFALEDIERVTTDESVQRAVRKLREERA